MAVGAARGEGLLPRAHAAAHLGGPLHMVPVAGLLVAQVARVAQPAAGEAQPAVAVPVMLARPAVLQLCLPSAAPAAYVRVIIRMSAFKNLEA